MRYYRFILIFLFTLFISNNLNSKPVPPGAGEGDVKANILILLDSSDSMKNDVGATDESLEWVNGAEYAPDGKIIVTQAKNSQGLLRILTNGLRDENFGDALDEISFTGANGCANNMFNNGLANEDVDLIANADPVIFENLTVNHSDVDISGETIIFFRASTGDTLSKRAIYGFDEDGQTCRFVIGFKGHNKQPNNVNYNQGSQLCGNGELIRLRGKVIGGIPYLFANIKNKCQNASKKYALLVVNLDTMQTQVTINCRTCTLGKISDFDIASDGTALWFVRNENELLKKKLTAVNGAFRLDNVNLRSCGNIDAPYGLVIDPDDDDIIYTAARLKHKIQKISHDHSTNGACTVVTSIGKGSNDKDMNKNDDGTAIAAGDLDADDVRFSEPWSIRASSTKVIVGTKYGMVDEFLKSKFNATDRDDAWQRQIGGPKTQRWIGAKEAIKAVVQDSTLLSGAYFGFGHWNSGQDGVFGKGVGVDFSGNECHKNQFCSYYGGWDDTIGAHPQGTSVDCSENSCLTNAVGPNGARDIVVTLDNLVQTAWGTDSRAFSQMAHDYFFDGNAGRQLWDADGNGTRDSECQLNYVIVIGDGAMANTDGATSTRLAILRDKGIKTLFVAYGGGISTKGKKEFEKLARIGSCTGGVAGDKECEAVITAKTPDRLKQDLTSKIRQIIAERLAFTAPSITASIQEGGSLYQAQFSYEQFGEWRGKLLRRAIDEDGNVDMTIEDQDGDGLADNGNWDASEEIRGQASEEEANDDRKLWTALENAPYFGNWDNFTNPTNFEAVFSLMELRGYVVQDYHNSTSKCTFAKSPNLVSQSDLARGEDGATDDAKGLIAFMRGIDYFDYDGDCNITEVREHVMGDIYHSQLIEVGPPEASLEFTSVNEEAYFRATNNYQSFISKKASRKNIIYAGSNSGVLHAIDSVTGKEIWGFIPPFVVTNIPQIVNKGYDGNVDNRVEGAGGTNPIFGVDGSPVVHDVLINKVNSDGTVETSKEWRTILFAPYGRGGAGFSVLDITDELDGSGLGPIHMFSVYNDRVNNEVLVAAADGEITSYPYNSGSANIATSEEGQKAFRNYTAARVIDDNNSSENNIVDTEKNTRATPCYTADNFYTSTSNKSCYVGKVFHFSGINTGLSNGDTIPVGQIQAFKDNPGGEPIPLAIQSAKIVQNRIKVTLKEDMIYNPYISANAAAGSNASKSTTPFSIQTTCKGSGFNEADMVYNYSQLGETWSTPRIVRIPSYDSPDNPAQDKYVAIMGGGMAGSDRCAGSALFVVSLETFTDAGSRLIPAGGIYGAHLNGGPIRIVDTKSQVLDTEGATVTTENASDIINSVPATPVVITPDTAFSIPWRGAMVYVNDLEGKITKFNLTSQSTAKMFDQTTLFRLDATTDNARYSYFGMDAGIGVDNGKFYLFGGTGNFADLGGREANMDNIMYGIIDPHYPLFKQLYDDPLPLGAANDFDIKAHLGANDARSIDNTAVSDAPVDPNQLDQDQEGGGKCIDRTGKTSGCINLSQKENAWVIGMDRDEASSSGGAPTFSERNFRKASGRPTLFRGNVYFPIYQPPPGNLKCNQGAAFICVADDECGNNGSQELKLADPPEDVNQAAGNVCGYVRKGVLSELVIFGDQLFANVAGPATDEETLVRILSVPGEVISNKGGWRDSSF